jgi:hypothetical protein
MEVATSLRPEEVCAVLRAGRVSLAREKETQADIASLLGARNIPHAREVDIGKRDIIDFLIDRIGIEVKIGGSKRAIFAQCERYCRTGRLSALILATNVAIGFPPEIAGIPCFVVSLGRGWL